MAPMQRSLKPGSCISNSCMKLWFEGRNVNVLDALQLNQCHTPAGPQRAKVLRSRGRGGTVPQTISATNRGNVPMDFNMSDRQKEWLGRVESFMTRHVRPAVPVYRQQDEAGERWKVIPVVE